jgi:hypothetical protein
MIFQLRKKKNKPKDIVYSLYLYFSGLLLRNISQILARFVTKFIVQLGIGFKNTKSKRLFYRKLRIAEFIIIYIKSGLRWL